MACSNNHPYIRLNYCLFSLVLSEEDDEFHALIPQNMVFPNGSTYGDELCHKRSIRDDNYAQGDRIILYIIPDMTDGNGVTTVKIIDDDGILHTELLR